MPPLAAGPLRGSQVCSALRRFQRLGLAYGHPFRPLGRRAFGPLFGLCLRRLRRLQNPENE
nr:hypothetical protein [Saprospira grandis]